MQYHSISYDAYRHVYYNDILYYVMQYHSMSYDVCSMYYSQQCACGIKLKGFIHIGIIICLH